MLDRDGTSVPATLVRPRGKDRDIPAWVVMHGITRPGRAHEQLIRFTHAIASAGLASIVPEVPEWIDLDLAPGLTGPSIAAAIRGLRDTGVVRDAPVGVFGFSFGGPHAIASVNDPEVGDQIAGTCAFGAYASIERTFHFMMTGHHDGEGEAHVLKPDPYGRWIVAANYLTSVPEHEDAGDVADALRALARAAGDDGVASWDVRYDPQIRALRAGLPEERRELFDVFAPVSDAPYRGEYGAQLAEGLGRAARSRNPEIDTSEILGGVRGPVHLLHGRVDHLIPFTETPRLAGMLPDADVRVTVTRLFGHSKQDPFPVARGLSEVPKFTRALGDVLATI